MKTHWLASALMACALVACAADEAGKGEGDDDDNGASGGSGGDGGSVASAGAGGVGSGGSGPGGAGGGSDQPIPDPGPGMDQWTSNGDISTPDKAWQVGTATNGSPYVEGTAANANGNAFFVFEAGPALTEITVFVTTMSDFVHLHHGDGLLFGAEVPATSSQATGGTWTVVPGSIYVLEVHVPGGGFF